MYLLAPIIFPNLSLFLFFFYFNVFIKDTFVSFRLSYPSQFIFFPSSFFYYRYICIFCSNYLSKFIRFFLYLATCQLLLFIVFASLYLFILLCQTSRLFRLKKKKDNLDYIRIHFNNVLSKSEFWIKMPIRIIWSYLTNYIFINNYSGNTFTIAIIYSVVLTK